MNVFRRFAPLVALLVFLTSGPLGASHMAADAVPRPPCHPAALGGAVIESHAPVSVPDGTGCAICHLLQQVRGPVSTVAAIGDVSPGQLRHLALDQSPLQLALVELLPARAPPPTRS